MADSEEESSILHNGYCNPDITKIFVLQAAHMDGKVSKINLQYYFKHKKYHITQQPWHDFASCEGIQDSLGFYIYIPGIGFLMFCHWNMDSGFHFWILGSGFQIPWAEKGF